MFRNIIRIINYISLTKKKSDIKIEIFNIIIIHETLHARNKKIGVEGLKFLKRLILFVHLSWGEIIYVKWFKIPH